LPHRRMWRIRHPYKLLITPKKIGLRQAMKASLLFAQR
jgi:hypothetical protein